MLSRQQIADAYECHVGTIRPTLRAVGITHMKSISLEEFRRVIKKIGYPLNKNYQYFADQAMKGDQQKSHAQLSLFQGLWSTDDHLRFFPGIKNTHQ